jgi:hypothetical protein
MFRLLKYSTTNATYGNTLFLTSSLCRASTNSDLSLRTTGAGVPVGADECLHLRFDSAPCGVP